MLIEMHLILKYFRFDLVKQYSVNQWRSKTKTVKLLTQDLKTHFLTEKIRPVIPVLTSHAGIMPVTEKKK